MTPPGGLSASALVLATMQNVAGGVLVKAAVPNPGAGTVQITLNKAPLFPGHGHRGLVRRELTPLEVRPFAH